MTWLTKARAVGTAGEAEVTKICALGGAVFRRIGGSEDVGVDGHIEFTEAGKATGHWIKIQVKSGASTRNPDGSYTFKADRSHFSLWARGLLPVAGVIYDPDSDACVWVDITGFLRSHPNVVEEGPYSIRVAATATFSAKAVAGEFQTSMLRHLFRNGAWRAAELVCQDHEEDQVEGFLGLFGAPENRESRLACELALSRCFRLHPRAMRLAVHAIARYFPHPEGGWFTSNSGDLQSYCWRTVGDWGKEEFQVLLAHVDPDEDLGRGSYGQAVMVLLQATFDGCGTLVEIMSDRSAPFAARRYAIGCLEHFGSVRALIYLQAYAAELRDDGLGSEVAWALEFLPEFLEDELGPDYMPPPPVDPNQLRLFGRLW